MPVPYVGHRDKGGSVAEDKASAQKAEEAAEGDASTINNLTCVLRLRDCFGHGGGWEQYALAREIMWA